MPIVPNSAPDELDSPFYRENEKLCNDWSDFILNKGGAINGKFNAWSFMIKSKVTTNRTWLIDVKKATFSNGFLMFSSKYQNLQEILTFRTIFSGTNCDKFLIRKSRFKGRDPGHKFSNAITSLLKEGLIDNSVYEVRFENSELTIVFHHKNDWFNMAEKILAFEYNE